MSFIMALTREADAKDDRTWQLIVLEDDPREGGVSIGGAYEDEGLTWTVSDIFEDEDEDEEDAA